MKRIMLTALVISCSLAGFCQSPDSKYVVGDSMFSIKLKSEPKFYVNFHGGYSMALGSTFKFYPDDVSSIQLKMSD